VKTKSALSWFGSDSEVAAQLGSLLDLCSHVTIPFVGGASILPHLKARAIVANDLHAHAVNFYRTLGGRHGEAMQKRLIEVCDYTLCHPDEMTAATKLLESESELERAWAFWAICWLGRKGKGGMSAPPTVPSVRWSSNGGTNATRIKAAAADLTAWAKEFERCEWQQLDFGDILRKVKDEWPCGVYCDPPWVDAGDEYLHRFEEQDHRDLAEMLARFERTRVVVRYGDHEFIRELYQGWKIIEASSRTQANLRTGEIWITKNLPS
jgi:site-specific DNA-adenine methylase